MTEWQHLYERGRIGGAKDPTIEADAGLSALAWISLALNWVRERQEGMRRRNTRNEDLDPFARHPQADGIEATGPAPWHGIYRDISIIIQKCKFASGIEISIMIVPQPLMLPVDFVTSRSNVKYDGPAGQPRIQC